MMGDEYTKEILLVLNICSISHISGRAHWSKETMRITDLSHKIKALYEPHMFFFLNLF